jgi:dihydroorotate dehydrogenase subfamily 1
MLIASIMEENRKEAWQKITTMVQDCGVDGLELNLSCPHGLPERKMGQEVGVHPDLVEQVTRWVTEVARVPVWAKMTPNITNIIDPSMGAVRGGAHGISAINTILSVIGVDLATFQPMPTVEGHSVPGGYSSQAVRPIALRQVMELGRAMPKHVSVCGIGGIERASDAIQFFLLGASTVQVCTAVMLYGIEIVKEMTEGTAAWMKERGFATLKEAVGKSLPFFSTHADRAKAGESGRDNEWAEKRIEDKTTELTANQ